MSRRFTEGSTGLSAARLEGGCHAGRKDGELVAAVAPAAHAAPPKRSALVITARAALARTVARVVPRARSFD